MRAGARASLSSNWVLPRTDSNGSSFGSHTRFSATPHDDLYRHGFLFDESVDPFSLDARVRVIQSPRERGRDQYRSGLRAHRKVRRFVDWLPEDDLLHSTECGTPERAREDPAGIDPTGQPAVDRSVVFDPELRRATGIDRSL
jgi:hypothetical protein